LGSQLREQFQVVKAGAYCEQLKALGFASRGKI